MQVRALILDFDGLILDTETPEFLCWSDIFARYDASLTLEAWGIGVGTQDAFDPFEHLESLSGRPVDRAAVGAEIHDRMRERIELELPRPGVVALLDDARDAGLQVAVASSSYYEWVSRWLKRHALLERFDCIRTRDDVVHVKPHPEVYLATAKRLGLDPSACLAFEDSPNGMKAAIAAGMRVIAVPNPVTANLQLPPNVTRLESLADQPLSRLLAGI